MADIWPQIMDRIGRYADEMADLQSDLVATPAVGPGSGGPGEFDKAAVMEMWLDRIKPDRRLRIDAPDERAPAGLRPNIAAWFNGDGSSGRTVWVLSHLDVVPPGERGLWASDPYTLRRKNGVLYGRGVEDNHVGIVMSYFAVKALREMGLAPKHRVGLLFVADEESGSEYGLKYILEKRPDIFSPDDLIIVPDSGNEDGTDIEVAEKSMLWVKFVVSGRQCHASRPDLGVNTLRASARIVTAVDQALAAAFPGRNELFHPSGSTCEPTKKEANVPNINTIPGEDVFYFDCRILPEYDLDRVISTMTLTAEREAAELGATVALEIVQKLQAPPATPADSPVVSALSRAIHVVRGKTARPVGIGGGTVAAFFREKGLPAAVWSTSEEKAHMPNESVRIDNLIADARVLAHVFLGL